MVGFARYHVSIQFKRLSPCVNGKQRPGHPGNHFLTLPRRRPKKWPVPAVPPGFYAQWRAQQEARLLLRERDSTSPPERLLQTVWHHQRLRRDELRTVQGQPLRVLHPGFWNHQPGPDFRGAILQFGQDEPCAGDIEIDLVARNWQVHRHDVNPAFSGVILHIVWEDDAKPRCAAPVLELKSFLDVPLRELETWAATNAAERWPESLRGACSAPLAPLPQEQMEELLQQAAMVRFQRKARDLETRARFAGWEQTLWEGIFRALGYRQNVWPMQRVAELLPQLRGHGETAQAWQALLLGIGGFLPTDFPANHPSARYARGLWDHWWREREKFSELLLPKKIWRLQGLRPANHPQRRLALASHWLAANNFIGRLEQWFAGEHPVGSLASGLLDCLQAPVDEFWSWHWTFSSPRLPKPQPLLGESRATDLAINVLLPWFWARSRAGQNETLAQAAERRYLAWPQAQDNALLRLARERLLGARTASPLNSAARQQGLLQIIHDFCDHSNALCVDCAFPSLVRSLV